MARNRLKGCNIDEECYWVDPAGESSGWYFVSGVNACTDSKRIEKSNAAGEIDWDNTIIDIDTEFSHAEVYFRELRFGKSKSRRKCCAA